MADLYHVGVSEELVPDDVLLVDPALPLEQVLSPLADVTPLSRRREYTVGIGRWNATSVLVTTVGVGGPPLAIAIEELTRAGARNVVLLGTTAVEETAGPTPWLLPWAAVRSEGTTSHYAPDAYPAVADARLFQLLSDHAGARAVSGLVESVDLVTEGHAPLDDALVAVELRCACLFVVSAARGVRTAAVLVRRQGLGTVGELALTAYRCLEEVDH